MLLKKDGAIVCALKGGFGCMQIEGVVQHAGFFHIEFGLVRIVFALLQVFGMIAVDRGDGMVVAGFSIAVQNLFHHFVPVGCIFEAQPDIVVVIRFHGRHHGHGVVEGSRRCHDLNAF